MFTYIGSKEVKKTKTEDRLNNRLLVWNLTRFPEGFLEKYSTKVRATRVRTHYTSAEKADALVCKIERLYESSKQKETESATTAKSGQIRSRIYDLNGERKARRSA